jgi:hypothetical protein
MIRQYTIVDGARQKAARIQRGRRLLDVPRMVRARTVGIILVGIFLIIQVPFFIIQMHTTLASIIRYSDKLDLGILTAGILMIAVLLVSSILFIGVLAPAMLGVGPYENGLQADLNLFIPWSQIYELQETEDKPNGRSVWIFTRPPMKDSEGILDFDNRTRIDASYVFELYGSECVRVTMEMTGVKMGAARPPRLNVFSSH